MKSISLAFRTAFRKFTAGRLSRTQYALAVVTVLWVVPVLAMVVAAWEPILSILMKDKAADWAAAVGSIAAAWAAMAAAIYPQRVRRREEMREGAAEAVARKNVVDVALSALSGLDERYRVNENNLFRLRDERLAEEHTHQTASELLSKTDTFDIERYRPLKDKVAETTKTLERIGSDIEHCVRIRDRIGETLDDAMLRLDAVPASTIRRFDFVLGTHITQAVNQLHAANAIFKRYRTTSTFEIAVNTAIAALNDYMKRVTKAEEFVERISAQQR